MYTYVCIYTHSYIDTSPNKSSAEFIPPLKVQTVIAETQMLNAIRVYTLITSRQDTRAAHGPCCTWIT